MNPNTKYRGRQSEDRLIAFSIAYERHNLLARGLGLEHLRELVLGIARPLLRQGANLAYGGSWAEMEGNFTYDLLGLIKAEQEDNSLGGPDTSATIGMLFNHVAWPYYANITPDIEAQWINCCRIIRVTQEDAGFGGDEIISDEEPDPASDRFLFNRAYTLSTMRRIMAEGCDLSLPALGHQAFVPGVDARIVIGGKTNGYAGMMPGIFEETLHALNRNRPLYILGGFGGGAELLAKGLLAQPGESIPELNYDYHRRNTPDVARIHDLCGRFRKPADFTPESLFDEFQDAIRQAAANFPHSLYNGLDEAQNRALMTTSDISEARRLVRTGLDNGFGMSRLAY